MYISGTVETGRDIMVLQGLVGTLMVLQGLVGISMRG